ncbi:unnamed protein product [Arctia plantaginis]|uniref:CCHC-type domain-containing protein n=1 Tax=Arctia plantaginis TaxID=874455 RepID=A0A8S0ZLW1_ARCPL|nr:unnamed protein product [Arctia plantaginis]CAB3238356.1 unnamed protein product [Arctia plantaginis]
MEVASPPYLTKGSTQTSKLFEVLKEVKDVKASVKKGSRVICYRCGERGHLQLSCPLKSSHMSRLTRIEDRLEELTKKCGEQRCVDGRRTFQDRGSEMHDSKKKDDVIEQCNEVVRFRKSTSTPYLEPKGFIVRRTKVTTLWPWEDEIGNEESTGGWRLPTSAHRVESSM